MAKSNGTFRAIKIIGIIAGLIVGLCGTVWAFAGKFADHDNRLTTLETHIPYIKAALKRIEEKVNE